MMAIGTGIAIAKCSVVSSMTTPLREGSGGDLIAIVKERPCRLLSEELM